MNQVGGSITGTFDGIGSDATLNLTNSGVIAGGTAAGVGFGSGSLVNNLGGDDQQHFRPGRRHGLLDHRQQRSDLVDERRRRPRSTSGVTLTNNASGAILGDDGRPRARRSRQPSTIANSGTITGTAGAGVSLTAGATLTNNSDGVITGATHGVYADNTGPGT